jgi:hypothetical protein
MAKSRAIPASNCRRVKIKGTTWYCCCGRTAKKFRGKKRPACACAPMVGKNKVDARRTVRFWVDEKGKSHRF